MEKILIGNKQYVGKQNVDNYIDIDLARTVETIKRDTLDNVFDFQQQYILERNDSMKFCVYGLVESRFGHCDNIAINVSVGDSDMSGATNDVLYLPNMWSAGTSGYTTTTLSYPLNAHTNNSSFSLSKNLYGAARGSYFVLFELDKNEILKSKKNKSVFLEIYEPIKEMFGKFSIPIIYFDSDGEIVEFGTQNAEFNNANDIVEINNDFPFFYDRHWVKYHLEPYGPHTVFFVDEDTITSETNNLVNIDVSLSEPSITGLERCRIIIDFGVDQNGNLLTTSDFGLDFTFTEPILNWSPGEQVKSFPVTIINDFLVENQIETIVFRIVPISNVKINPSQQYKHTLRIESEDVPVRADFTNPIYYFSEPNLNTATVTAFTVDVQFSSPLTIPGERVGIQIVGTSGMTLGQDFYFDPTDITLSEISITSPLSGTGVNFPIYITGNKKYNIDRSITLRIKQLTNNIILGNTNVETTISVSDGLTKKYVRYIIPFDLDKGTGAFKVIYNGTNRLSSSVAILQQEQPDLSAPYQNKNLNVTHLFSCDLRVKNLGDRIVWNNQYIDYLKTFDIKLDFSAATSDIIIDLPTNDTYDHVGNFYKNTKYELTFQNFSRFYPNSLPSLFYSLANNANDFVKKVITETHSGGTIGNVKKYLITELTDVKTQYDEINDACLITGHLPNQTIKYNGAIFLPNPVANYNYPPGSFSKSKLKFSNQKVLHRCNVTGGTLPVGTQFLPEPPYIEQFVQLNFGAIYLQGGYIASNSSDKLRLGATNTPGGPSAHAYFRTWQATHVDTQANAKFRIHNKGDREVVILGKTISTYAYRDFDSSELDFQNLSLMLPTNEGYSASTNSFSHTNYLFEFIDFRIYNGNNYANQTISKTLPLFNVTGTSLTNLQSYYIKTRYHDVKIGSSLFGVFDCQTSTITAPNTVVRDVFMNDLLFYANTGTIEGSIIYTKYTITPECPQSLMKYEFF